MHTQEIIDRDELFVRVDEDMDLLQELIDLFLQDYPQLISQIETALQNQDGPALREAAHTLKGSVGNFCAQGAFEAAHKLEMAGYYNNFSTVDDDYERLLQEIERVTNALQSLSREAVV